jgi:hypothetical protein
MKDLLLQAEIFLDLPNQPGAKLLLVTMHWQDRPFIATNDRDVAAPCLSRTCRLSQRLNSFDVI